MSNLAKEIISRRSGHTTYAHLQKLVLQNRCRDFSLSSQIDFEPAHSSAVNCLDADKSGRYLLSGGKDGTIFIHDLFNFTGKPGYRCRLVQGAERNAIQGHPLSVETVQWFPFDSGMFLSSGMDKAVRVWDANAMIPVETYQITNKIYQHHMSSVVSTNVPLLAIASSANQVMLADLKSGQYTHELRGHTSSVMCCAWSPIAEYLLVTGSCDSTIKLWDVRAARSLFCSLDSRNRPSDQTKNDPPKAHNGFVNGLSFSPQGRLLMSMGTDDQLRCWDLHTQKNLDIAFEKVPNKRNKTLNFQTFGYEYFNVCFVPSEGNIVIFEVETGKKIKTLSGHFNLVNSCYFQRDRMELYSGGQDRNILLWSHVKELKELEDSTKNKVKSELVVRDNWSDTEEQNVIEEDQDSDWDSSGS